MKTSLKLVVAFLLFASFGTLRAQEKGQFKDINLNELKRTVLNELKADQLIRKKDQPVLLFFKSDGIEFNGQKFNSELNQKYDQLLSDYNIGSGLYRTVLITAHCTAVGDFREESFSGKFEGRLNPEDTRKVFEALE